jgi:hypothetical protein
MYTEEYEHKGFPFRDFLLRLILIVIFVFLLIWLLPKFINSSKVESNNSNESNNITNTSSSTSKTSIASALSPLTSQIFADNIDKMKEAAISYYTDSRLPKNVSDSETMTLSDMIGKKIIVALVDKNGKACDLEKSYVKITKLDDEYLLKINLKGSDKEDYILVHLGCYTYCKSAVCEKEYSNVSVKASKSTSVVAIKASTAVYHNSDTTGGSSTPTSSVTNNPSTPVTPTPVANYLYEYSKTTGAEFSAWTKWSNWSKSSCSIQSYNCTDSDPTCLRKVQTYSRKEKIGTYQKEYLTTRQELVQTGSYQEKSCSNYNYTIINHTTYATTTTITYTTTRYITTCNHTSCGSWVYSGHGDYTNSPSDTATTSYKFTGLDYSNCNDQCTSLPKFGYDRYTYAGGVTSVSSTTTPGSTTSSSSSSTSSSTSSSVTASCGSYVYKTVPIYSYITVTDKASRTEPLYGTVCYTSTKTRTLTDAGKTQIKWSTYNDTSLLNNGWHYTGAKKKA